MRWYLVKIPRILPFLQPKGLIWKGPERRGIYLTFDDGPHPEITPQVLALLKRYNAKATFFCVGENAARYPQVIAQILAEGHTLGNHTYNHLKGSKTSAAEYLSNTLKAAQILDTGWFRPPYGLIRREQAKELQAQGFRIVMWDVLSADFDLRYTATDCARFVLRHARRGSIVVFHDSVKAAPRCLPALEIVLQHYQEQNTPLLALPPFFRKNQPT